ncbi:hypothetical protein PTSG_05698 [Salpingoeca rosetta]|uniref:GHMP kinase N-terminal domain-containing protein n=1 Tax=Salpingoeca rosetta (strain ATCC 50818 / BSB-021) TaxID=946362 RepID=F2UAY8_SALR5|nr:uncharacterized protein PTSG_05698 [Salpingoeca rosetta]EGD74001.1 hypothetical protein PTSG_05698 [Salpingoeca rosetta]|eukprot:XP_004993564.1 hypothetical protein PTSG_05698 [Salpingoeca rosetta]
MKCVILVAGHATRLEAELRADTSGKYASLVGIPKALLPGPDGRPILDQWWAAVNTASHISSDVYLVTNAEKYKHYERWATANGFPRQNIINDGTTSSTGGIGAIADLDLAIRSRSIDDDLLVVSGDMLFNPKSFDLDGVLQYFKARGGELSCYYAMHPGEDSTSRGILELNEDHQVTNFFEKPKPGTTTSRLASVVLYCFKRETLGLIRKFAEDAATTRRSLGHLMEALVKQTPVYGMKLPDHFGLIGAVGVKEYHQCLQAAQAERSGRSVGPIVRRAYARVGLMGNPSDGFFGKTISLAIRNYWAQATITPNDTLVLEPHPLNDPTEFGSLADLCGISKKEGYQGGLRLMQATCKKFFEFCSERGIAIARRNFRLKYDTNIPRQVGLAGSSAICTAVLKCLVAFFNLTQEDFPLPVQANFVLSVETQELGINAGLQDRVIQAYNGCVYMDFSKEIMDAQGYGHYEQLPVSKLPQFWLGYLADPSDSGKIHSNIRQRYNSGEEAVVSGMQQFAAFTDAARAAILSGQHNTLADLMDKNFDLRRQLYGDECLGEANLKMVAIARKHNSAVKFPGSGGAVVGLCRNSESMRALQEEFEANNFVFVKVIPRGQDEPHE